MKIRLHMPLLVGLVLVTALACDDDETQGGSAGMAVDPMEGLIRDTGGESAPGSGGTSTSAGSMSSDTSNDENANAVAGSTSSNGGGMMSMGGSDIPMYPPPRPVNDCTGACARYAECDRVEDVFGTGGEGACLERCERATRGGDEAAEVWWQCLSQDQCNVVNRCPLPSVDPLSCVEVCGLVDRCDGTVGVGDCEQTCAANEVAFRECGETLFGQCEPENFNRCLATEVFPSCGEYCTAAVDCNVIVSDGCETSCIQRYIRNDALELSSFERVNQCVQGAAQMMDCQSMNACVQPFTFAPPEVPSSEAFCNRYSACEFGVFDNDCQMEYEAALLQGPYYVNCIFEGLAAECPQFFFQLEGTCEEQGNREIAEACNRYCLAQESCGDEPDFNLAECSMMCQMNFTNDPDANERVQSEILCIREETCPAFEVCQEAASPEGQCMRFCASRSACGDIEDDCLAQCDTNWPRNRHAAWRACVEQANGDCDTVNACVLAPSVPCEEACAKKAECELGSDRCAAICDDRQFDNPVEVALEVACILSAPECTGDDSISVAACMADPLVAGTSCLNFCRAKTNCAPDADLASCLTPCVTGFPNVDGLFFEASQECLGALAADAECAALEACIPETVNVDCEGYCTQLEACAIERADCLAECETNPPLDRAGCSVEAIRVGQQCGGVARCEGVDGINVSAQCQRYCAEQSKCDESLDTYLCELGCADDPTFLPYRLACMESTQCDNQAACLQVEAVPDPRCDEACATLTACMALEADECNAICTGRLASPDTPDDYLMTLRQCLNDARDDLGMCDSEQAAACLEPKWCEIIGDPVRVPARGGLIPFNIAGGPEGPSGTCGGGQSQFAMIINVPTLSNASFTIVESDFDTVLTLRRDCNDVMSEVACNDDANGLRSRIPREADATILLPPGTYFLIIDVFRRLFGENGTGVINIEIEPVNGPGPVGGLPAGGEPTGGASMPIGGQPLGGAPSGGRSIGGMPAGGALEPMTAGREFAGRPGDGGQPTDEEGGTESGGTPMAGVRAGGEGGERPTAGANAAGQISGGSPTGGIASLDGGDNAPDNAGQAVGGGQVGGLNAAGQSASDTGGIESMGGMPSAAGRASPSGGTPTPAGQAAPGGSRPVGGQGNP